MKIYKAAIIGLGPSGLAKIKFFIDSSIMKLLHLTMKILIKETIILVFG